MISYFKVVKNRTEYKGVRYFEFDPQSEKVVQVVVNTGETKKGKTNLVGISYISRITFIANYLSMGYVEKCPKKVYRHNFDIVVKMLKPTP